MFRLATMLVIFVLLSWPPTDRRSPEIQPDRTTLTQGAIDPSLDRTALCVHDARRRRHVSRRVRRLVYAAYGLTPDSRVYRLDHLVPLELGGTNDASNLWPQAREASIRKDALENEMQRLVCLGILPLAQAQREIAQDWPAAYQRYMSNADQALTTPARRRT